MASIIGRRSTEKQSNQCLDGPSDLFGIRTAFQTNLFITVVAIRFHNVRLSRAEQVSRLVLDK